MKQEDLDKIEQVDKTLGQRVGMALQQYHKVQMTGLGTSGTEDMLATALSELILVNIHTPVVVEGEIVVCNICMNSEGNPIAWDLVHPEDRHTLVPNRLTPWSQNPGNKAAMTILTHMYVSDAISEALARHTFHGQDTVTEARSFAYTVATNALNTARGKK